MDTSKLSRYDWVVVAGMILMFIALFLTWYRVEIVQRSFRSSAVSSERRHSGFSVNGWHTSRRPGLVLTAVATPS